jgi:hypothetical protein
MVSHHANHGNNYVVKLSSPLNFSGSTLNEYVSREAALTTLQHTNRFYDLRENSTLYVVLELYTTGVINTNVEKPNGVTELAAKFTDTNLTDMNEIEKRIMKTFQAASHKPIGGTTCAVTSYVYGKILAPAGDYKNPLLLVQNLVSGSNMLFGGARYLSNMGIAVDGATGRVTFRIDNIQLGLYMFTDSVPLVHALGLSPKAIDKKDPAVYGLNIVGTKMPRFDTIHSLYVYTDIAKERRWATQWLHCWRSHLCAVYQATEYTWREPAYIPAG